MSCRRYTQYLSVHPREHWISDPNGLDPRWIDIYQYGYPNWSSILVHHSFVPDAAYFDSHGAVDTMLRMRDLHEGYPMCGAGIGYHFVIMPDGSKWMGRPENILGNHAGYGNNFENENPGRLGVVLIGEFNQSDIPTAAQIKALEDLSADLCLRYGISPASVLGHCDVGLTGAWCPGQNMYPHLDDVRETVHCLMHTYWQYGYADPNAYGYGYDYDYGYVYGDGTDPNENHDWCYSYGDPYSYSYGYGY